MAVEDLLIAYKAQVNTDISQETDIDSISPDMVANIGIDLADILQGELPKQNRFGITAGPDAPVGGVDTDLHFQAVANNIIIHRNIAGAWTALATIPLSLNALMDGKLTGLRLFISGMLATVTEGSWVISNVIYGKAAQTQFNLAAAHATYTRYDKIYADKFNQILIVAGVPAAAPVAPNLPADTILIETITVPSEASGLLPFTDYAANTQVVPVLKAITLTAADFEADLVTVINSELADIKTMEYRGIGPMIPGTDFTALVGGGFTIIYPGLEAGPDTAISITYI